MTFIALVAGGAAALYSAFYAGAAARERSRHELTRSTFELIRGVDEPELLKLREVLDQAIGDYRNVAPTTVLAKINESVELRTAARGLLNAFEDIAVAIRTGYADERLVHAAMGTLMCGSTEKYSSFIDGERARHGGGGSIYKELQRVTDSWRGGRYHTLDRAIPSDPCDSIKKERS